MNNIVFIQNLQHKGISNNQIDRILLHVKRAKDIVHNKNHSVEDAVVRMERSLYAALDKTDADFLSAILSKNIRDLPILQDKGFSLCYVCGGVAALLSEVLLIGGFLYESRMLGLRLTLSEVQRIVGSQLILPDKCMRKLIHIARKYGANQEFLFPGLICQLDNADMLLQQSILDTLSGSVVASSRIITGVGGMRYDYQLNAISDLKTLIGLKLHYDRRYYPGIIICYLLLYNSITSLPFFSGVSNDKAKGALLGLSKKLRIIQRVVVDKTKGLCSAYIPTHADIERVKKFAINTYVELSDAFHSLSYEFSSLFFFIEKIHKREIINDDDIQLVSFFHKKIEHLFSYNAVLHLPWTHDLSSMTNQLMGNIGTAYGDICTRYGVGANGKSVEVREYIFGKQFPFLQGKASYEIMTYTQSDAFVGPHKVAPLVPGDVAWQSLKSQGFLRTALAYM